MHLVFTCTPVRVNVGDSDLCCHFLFFFLFLFFHTPGESWCRQFRSLLAFPLLFFSFFVFFTHQERVTVGDSDLCCFLLFCFSHTR